MEIFKISAIGIITVFCALAVRENRPDMALLVSMTGGALILAFALNRFFDVFVFFNSLISAVGVDGAVVKNIVKIIGIGYVAEFSSAVAEESGLKSLAEKIVLGGKVIILVLSFPMIETLIKIIMSLLS